MGNASKYNVSYFIKKTSESTYPAAKYTGTNTSYTFTGLVQNTSYDIKVTTQDKAGNTGTRTITIDTNPLAIELTLNSMQEKMITRYTKQLTASIIPSRASQEVEWSSSNTNVATVDNTGKITAKAAGTTTIIVKTKDGSNLSRTCNVIVEDPTLEINSVRARIATGYTRWLTAAVTPSEAGQKLEWSSSNTNVATVDNTGKITAKAVGTTTITVKTKDGSNLSKTCNVTVASAVDITTLTSIQSSSKVAKDNYGNLITIPGGFKVLTSQATNVTQGVVIQDDKGNEFVWVPVDSVSKGTNERADDIRLGRYNNFRTQNICGNCVPYQDAADYTQTITIKKYYQELTNSSKHIIAKNLGDFVKKTQVNGGYYLGRYEASKGTDGKAKSQFNKVTWYPIKQSEGATAARGMYSSNYIESDLINSYSWDTALIFIQKYSGNSNYAYQNSITDSYQNTGTSGDKACNIYDIASNCIEWTTEYCTYGEQPCTIRGSFWNGMGDYAGSRESHKDSSFSANSPSSADKATHVSFRVILYLK